MYFYAICAEESKSPHHIKLGITTRDLGYRKDEYNTSAPHAYFKVAKFKCTLDELFAIEKRCLIATRQYLPDKYRFCHFNREWRFAENAAGVAVVWQLCEMQFAPHEFELVNQSEYDLKNSRQTELACSMISPRIHFNTLEEFENAYLLPVAPPLPMLAPLAKLQTLQLKGYQSEARNLINRFVKSEQSVRSYLEVFCGGGKTVLYQKIFEDHRGKFERFILVVPSIALMTDMRKRWGDLIRRHKWDMLCVSSESTYATTNADLIAEKMATVSLFVIVTMQSFNLVCNRENHSTFIILDEAHRMCNSGSPLCLLNLGKNVKIFAATATPKYGTYVEIKRNAVVMNNPQYFGEKIELKRPANLRRLYEEGFLCKYEIIMGRVTECDDFNRNVSNVQQYTNYYASSKLVAAMLNSDIGQRTHPRKILMYTNSINGIHVLQKMCEKYINAAGARLVSIYSASSKDSHRDRIDRVSKFTAVSEFDSILINCRLFSEGVNIINLDTVVFCDPKQSLMEVVQIFGRPLRFDAQNPDKIASIVIPFMDNVEYADAERYQKILNIVQKISSQDEFLAAEIKQKSASICSRSNIIRTTSVEGSSESDLNLKFNVDVKIFTYLRDMLDAGGTAAMILRILRDHIPRTPAELCWASNGNSVAEFAVECGKLAECGKILALGDKFYSPSCSKISMMEFAGRLKGMGIKTEAEYNRKFREMRYVDPYFSNPTVAYSGFEWSMLADSGRYTLEECRRAIDHLAPKIRKMQEETFLTIGEKNKILHEMDNRIPEDLEVYGVPLGKINILFRIRKQ